MPTRRLPLRCLPILLLPCAGPALAKPLTSAPPGCGGDAFSSAQVIEHRPARRGPLTAVPDTLCADLEPRQPAGPVDIQVYPGLPAQVGGGGGSAPYGGGPPRPRRF
ncbi:hypothetical protein [Methylobacterium trifolii]|uniref:Porin n=1 Tax=Methylobacterium trifolii TaxID=1003092 RepID=A0ABQ4U0U5_9HYPH|nr:hypothetical protein [Methylobacterium trifolii]GJE60896.1 hypothetical protein MPOCJGCO_3015 [Methylobacterium trifolii]